MSTEPDLKNAQMVKDYADQNITLDDHNSKLESAHSSEVDDVVSDDSSQEIKEKDSFIHNYLEVFKQKRFDPSSLLAPPMEIIAKTGYT